jgi:Terminase large subunit, T4likevirus-type, N-terminal
MSALAEDLAVALDPVQLARRVGIEPEPWQARLLRSTARRLILVAARQTGKSSMISLLALHQAAYSPGNLVLVVSSRQEASNEFVGKIRAWGRTLDVPTEGDAVTDVRFTNGSRLIALPATPTTTRGYSSAAMLIIDEAAWVPDDVFEAITPTLAASGRLVALSTPAGPQGWFWRAWTDQAGIWERHQVRASESRQYSSERLAEIRRLIGEHAFLADYEAEFSDPEGRFFRQELVDRALRPGVPLFPRRPAA